MILFFRSQADKVYAVSTSQSLKENDVQKLNWLFGNATFLKESRVAGFFIGPRKEMVTPWSTNAVEITQTMGITGINRIEEYLESKDEQAKHDKMLQVLYHGLDQELFDIHHDPEPLRGIEDIASYSAQEGLALSQEEIEFLNQVSRELSRTLTDSEVFGFSQVNSEHCRHKIFNGKFVIDGNEKPFTLFQLIKKTSLQNPNYIVSAYKDNVAFIQGPVIEQFAPQRPDAPSFFETRSITSALSLKAETHNFPTTVEPFNGAATGSGGEIRDRLAGGKGSLPLAGTAVYITSYPRLDGGRPWEKKFPERKWLYQSPAEILIKASDGASDFGNKFGQPLICGSVLTFEHFEGGKKHGFDKVIMLAGGIGFGNARDSEKGHLKPGDKIVLLGGDNYRIGLGGGAVSSVATGEYGHAIERNAVQRSNPEMQKRVMNAIRGMAESEHNPIVSIHDHGAGGHLNCFSELLEETGGMIELDRLPIGDPTLSDKEIISNESQERMGLALHEEGLAILNRVAQRERAPFYVVGEATGDKKLIFGRKGAQQQPIDLKVAHLFGSSPKTIITDKKSTGRFQALHYDASQLVPYLEMMLQLESVACKDWLTNKVDRSVTGKVALQQTCGPLQLPLNNLGVMALDYSNGKGMATSVGHAPAASLIDAAGGSKLAIAKALTNIVWTPLTHGLKGISLSANWMWPCKNAGEDARLYEAVEAVSAFAIALGINIPTGKDSLSMVQKYPDGDVVYSPGTVIISAMGECKDISQSISPALVPFPGSTLVYIALSGDGFKLGGSAFAQVLGLLGDDAPTVKNDTLFVDGFNALQELVSGSHLLAGHDISSGGLVTTLLEMCFPVPEIGMSLDLNPLGDDLIKALFSENPGVVIQVKDESPVRELLKAHHLPYVSLGKVVAERTLRLHHQEKVLALDIDHLRDKWFKTSSLLDSIQRPSHAPIRATNYKKQPLHYQFPAHFTGGFEVYGINPAHRGTPRPKAGIIREKGVNGDREMAYCLYLAGFDVKDIHMTDLIHGRENLEDVQMIAFVGGFSNSDVLGSAKGWAGSFLYNEKAKASIDAFYARKDTLSLGVCNGCQLMMELGLVYPDWKDHPTMLVNASGKFESAFINITIPKNQSVMLSTLAGTRLGAWLAHGEGRFALPNTYPYSVAAQYSYSEYPGNPNGSDHATAALCSTDGRHLAIMPHIERSNFPWNWAYYPQERKGDKVSPWIEAFVNARKWIEGVSR